MIGTTHMIVVLRLGEHQVFPSRVRNVGVTINDTISSAQKIQVMRILCKLSAVSVHRGIVIVKREACSARSHRCSFRIDMINIASLDLA